MALVKVTARYSLDSKKLISREVTEEEGYHDDTQFIKMLRDRWFAEQEGRSPCTATNANTAEPT